MIDESETSSYHGFDSDSVVSIVGYFLERFSRISNFFVFEFKYETSLFLKILFESDIAIFFGFLGYS